MNLEKCPICDGEIFRVMKCLKDTPLEDNFTEGENKLRKTPLDPYGCKKCGSMSLMTKEKATATYSEYLYCSEITVGLKKHFDLRAARLVDKYNIQEKELVFDIGCNDGCFLQSFERMGYQNLVGVEPAPKAREIAIKKGFNIYSGYFGEDHREKYSIQRPKLITANYMYANVSDPIGFMRSCSDLMKKESILSIETGYHPRQFELNMVDYIYHEHYFYYTIEGLSTLTEKCSLKISDIRCNEMKGGSIEVDIVRNDSTIDVQSNKIIKYYKEQEKVRGLINKDYYDEVEERVRVNIESVKKMIRKFLNDDGIAIAFGASHSTTTLLNLLELDMKTIEYIIDDNIVKQGRYSPNTNIKVMPASYCKNDKRKKMILCLAWQHRISILKKYLGNLNEKSWLIPLPNVQIIKACNE